MHIMLHQILSLAAILIANVYVAFDIHCYIVQPYLKAIQCIYMHACLCVFYEFLPMLLTDLTLA